MTEAEVPQRFRIKKKVELKNLKQSEPVSETMVYNYVNLKVPFGIPFIFCSTQKTTQVKFR
jgi:hypothetical protein